MATEGGSGQEPARAIRYEQPIDPNSDSTHAMVVRQVGWNKRVLELGCATGYMSAALRGQGCEVVGVELDPDAASAAVAYCERVIVGDVEHLDWRRELGEDRFDVIVVADVLEHLKDPLPILRGAKQFLRDDGYVVASIPNIAHGSIRLGLLRGHFTYRPVGLLDETHLRFFTRDSMHELFGAAGFVLTHLDRKLIPIDLVEEAEFTPATIPAEIVDQLNHDLDAQTYQFVVVARPVESRQLEAVQRRIRELHANAEELHAEIAALQTQIGEREATILNLRGQVAEQASWARANAADVVARDGIIQDLRRQVEQQTNWAQASAAEVTKRDAVVEELKGALDSRDASLHQQEATAAELGARLSRAQDTLSTLNLELAERRDQVEHLRAEVGTLSLALEAARRQAEADAAAVAAITASRGWRLLQWLWRVRLRLVPRHSIGERALQLPGRAAQGWRSDGITGLARATVPYRARLFLRRSVFKKQPAPAMSPPWNGVTAVNGAAAPGTASAGPGPSLENLRKPSSYDVIVFPIIDWDFRFQRPQQIAVRFARTGHRVLYCATVFNGTDRVCTRRLDDDVVEVQLPGPAAGSLYTDTMSPSLQSKLLEAFASLRTQLGIADAICLVDLPFWGPLALALRERYGWRVVYDCMDEHSGFSTVGAAMLRAEEELSRESDLVLATSRSIHGTQAARNPRCVLVPNAADFEHFRFALPVVPEELRDIPRPIVGYYGAVSDWLDTELVGTLARARPNLQFVLIGSTFSADLAPLRGLTNVHLLGEKPYPTLPSYLHGFDVCIIPFKDLPLTQATNPVKLFEYLSAGKSVVATRLRELEYYEDHVALTSTAEEWLAGIDQALQSATPEAIHERVEFARENSWDARLATIAKHVDTLYPLVSIILVTYNNEDYTRLCLQSIYEKTSYPNYEIVVVDNASQDGTRELLTSYQREHDNFTAVFSDDNEGFARGNNRGIAAARGEYVVFLNNDTLVTAGWLSRLLYHLREPKVGMVGPVTNSSGNESRIEVPYSTIAEMDVFAEAYTRAHFGETFAIGMLALFCVAMRKSVIDEVGVLDERFGIGMFEDDDYALRIREKGYSILCAEDVFIHHWGSASFSKLADAKYRALFDENRQKFEEKWGRAWEPHRYREVPV